MKVHEIMTREVLSCRIDADVGTAARLMLDGQVGTLPVVDAHHKLVGMITDRDIAMAVATRQRNASHVAVHEAMSRFVRVCFANDEIGDALKQMEEGRVRRLPVVDPTGHLTGIVSMDDVVLRALGRRKGVAPTEFIRALREICSRPAPEPEFDVTETFVSG